VTAAAPDRIPIVNYLALDDGDPHLVAQACAACGALYFDRRNACARCGRTEFTDQALETTGTVRAFTIVQRAAPNVPVPYVSAVVALDGGGVVKANLKEIDASPDRVALGMRVALTTFVAGTDANGTDAVAFGFAPA